jgi:hypothetical protein
MKRATARSRTHGSTLTLGNQHLTIALDVSNRSLRATTVTDHHSGQKIALGPDAFILELTGGRVLKSSKIRLTEEPQSARLAADADSIQKAGKRHGVQVTANFRDTETGAQFRWRAIVLDDTRYVRQELTVTAGHQDLPVRNIVMWDFDAPGVKVVGTVKGSPAVIGNCFWGFEHPLSLTTVSGSRVRCSLPRELPVRAGQSVVYSSVIGAAPDGQLRRGFLSYVEDQRAHPYRPFLHYNSWYDLGYFSKYDEAGVLDRIRAFGLELHEKRGTVLNSFLFDDGWDDPSTLWNFHSGFPTGFAKASRAAAEYGAGIGVWLSPWGGYGKPKQDRVKYGREQGFEIAGNGFALSGPRYNQRFRDACLQMMTDYKVNQFKIDGTGNANQVMPGSRFDSDFDAAISLIGDLREASQDLYVNLTTGTYASPFWLRFTDSIWRGGEDHDFAGVGSWRQKWITYRDADTYRNVVKAGPLFPINSLMLHGLIFAKHAKNLDSDPGGDFRSEIHSYFATGTQLQEMYITPELLSDANWSDLAEAANWSRRHAQTLIDSHWIGGDPAMLDVYGWAAWSPAGGILTLRNPSEREQTFQVDVGAAFELPPDAPGRYRVASPWKSHSRNLDSGVESGKPREFRLAPFEVLNIECTPLNAKESIRQEWKESK